MALPALLALYRDTRAKNPAAPMLTDEQIYDLLSVDSHALVATAQQWIDEHPKL